MGVNMLTLSLLKVGCHAASLQLHSNRDILHKHLLCYLKQQPRMLVCTTVYMEKDESDRKMAFFLQHYMTPSGPVCDCCVA